MPKTLLGRLHGDGQGGCTAHRLRQFDWSLYASDSLRSRTKRVGKRQAFTARLKTELLTNLGALMVPQVAYMETLGLDTLNIRYQRQASTTPWLAQQCRTMPGIERVNYIGLPDNPYLCRLWGRGYIFFRKRRTLQPK